MANRQSRIVPLADFKGKGETGSNVANIPAESGAGETLAVAKEFAGLSDYLARWADRAAIGEGGRAGTKAALEQGDGVALRRDGTLSGEAFDKAVIDTRAAQLEIAVRNDMFTIAEAAKDDPDKMRGGFDKLLAAYKTKAGLDPELQAHFEKRFGDLRFSYETAAVRGRDTRVRQQAAASYGTMLDTVKKDALRAAFTFGDDPAGDAKLAAESARIKSMIGNARDNRYITPEAAARDLIDFDGDIQTQKVAGSFARIEGVEAKTAFLKKIEADYRAGKVLTALDPDQFARTLHGLQADMNREKAAMNQAAREIREGVKSIRSRALDGYGVADSEWSDLERLAQNGGESFQQDLKAARTEAAMIEHWWTMRPADLDAAINLERNRLSVTATPQEKARMAAAVHVRDAMGREIKDDLIGFSERIGRIAPTTLDPQVLSNPELIGPAFVKRKAAAEQAAEFAGVKPQYFTKYERAEWAKVFNAGGDAATAAATVMAQQWGPDTAARAVAEIAPKAGVMAQAAAVAAAGGSRDFLADVARQRAMAGMDGYRAMEFKQPAVESGAAAEYGAAFSAAPVSRERAVAAARAAFEARARDQGFASDVSVGNGRKQFRQALQEAAGAVFDNGTQYGGVASVNGRKTVIPSSIRAAGMEDVLATLRDADFAEPPIGANGKSLTVRDIKSGALVAIGDGKYRVARGDPQSERPQWLMDAGTGEPWVLDIKALEPALRERRPDLFRGGR